MSLAPAPPDDHDEGVSGSGVDPDLITSAVALAARAPSLHNTQPWRCVADGSGLQLHLDRSRIVRTADARGREAVIGCGALLDHLRVGLAAAGWAAEVQRFPDPADIAHLATLTLRHGENPGQGARRRADAILARHTDRLPLRPPTAWSRFEPLLRAALASTCVRLDVLPDGLRDELAQASGLTERTQRFSAGYQAELDWWTSPFEYTEGIPRSALISVQESDRVALNRSFPSEGQRSRRAEIGVDHATILILSTPDDTYADALAAGEALSVVLLECTAAGLSTCPVTHVTEIPAARAVVAALTGGSTVPQILVRVGRAPELKETAPRTPRRDTSAFLTWVRAE